MAASVVDALMITLGLDTSNYDKGQKGVTEGMKKSRENAKETAKFMEEQGKKASSFFSSIKNELLALAGVSLSAAGLTSFVKSTNSSLMELSIQSKALGISAKELDGWGKAADAAGSSAQKITGTLTNFQNAIQAYRSGDASSPIITALAMLNSDTGTTFDLAKMNSSEMLKAVFEALQKEKSPERARYIATIAGIDDAQLQAARAGTLLPNVQRYTSESGVNNSDETVKKFNEQWTTLQQKLEKTGYYIFNALSPYIETFTKYLMELADWAASHPKEIKDSIMGLFNSIMDLAKACDDAVQWVGGWKNAILILIGASVGGKLLSFLSLLTGSLFGLSKIVLPAWLIAAAGLNASEKIDTAREEAAKNGMTIGEYLVKKAQSENKSDGLLSGADDALSKAYAWWDKMSSTNGQTNAYNAYGTINAPQASGRGKALLDFMSGQFGQLEAKFGLPVGLLRSVATVESGGNPTVTSKAGAQGLFQFMPRTAKELGINPMDPAQAAEGAARYLAWLNTQTGGNLRDTLRAYNHGIGNVKKHGPERDPLETQLYVPKVLAGLPTGSAASSLSYIPMTGAAKASAQEININGVTISSPATSVDPLTRDIMQAANNRVRLAGYESGQY